MRFEPGTPVRCVGTKWRDRPHWEYDATYLGADDHGDWIGCPPGTRFTRPGADFVAAYAQVTLVPAEDLAERGWLATFHAPDGQVRTYVDITSPPRWRFTTLTYVDLDLDVVQGLTGRVWVDDEDEFAEHREQWAYPEIVTVAAVGSCAAVERAVRKGELPFDGETHLPWLARLAAD